MSEPTFQLPLTSRTGVRRLQRPDLEVLLRQQLVQRGYTPEMIQREMPELLARAQSNPAEAPARAPATNASRSVSTSGLIVKSVDGRRYGLRRWKSTIDRAQTSRQVATLIADVEAAHQAIAGLLMAVREIALGGNPISVLRAYGLQVTPLRTQTGNGDVVSDVTLINTDAEEAAGENYLSLVSRASLDDGNVVRERNFLQERQPVVLAPEPAGDEPLKLDDSDAIKEIEAQFGVEPPAPPAPVEPDDHNDAEEGARSIDDELNALGAWTSSDVDAQ